MNTTTSFHDLPPHKRLRILQQQQKDQQPCSPLPTKKRKESRNTSFPDSPNNNNPPSPPPPSYFSLPTKKRIRAFQPPNDVVLVPPFDLNIEYNPSPDKKPQQTSSNAENEIDNDNDDGILCCVCQSTDANAEDPIVFCDGCDLMVHASCYGNPLSNKIPDGDWFCERCLFKTESKNDVVCALCPNKEGAMKRTTEEGKWAHIVCALLVPEVFFLDPEGREGIDFSRVPNKRWLQKCYVCDCGDVVALKLS